MVISVVAERASIDGPRGVARFGWCVVEASRPAVASSK
jgi:hypothetical protein